MKFRREVTANRYTHLQIEVGFLNNDSVTEVQLYCGIYSWHCDSEDAMNLLIKYRPMPKIMPIEGCK